MSDSNSRLVYSTETGRIDISGSLVCSGMTGVVRIQSVIRTWKQ